MIEGALKRYVAMLDQGKEQANIEIEVEKTRKNAGKERKNR
jgi:hypothetical protein